MYEVISSQKASEILKEVSKSNYFKLCNGSVLKGIYDFRDTLKDMDDGTFSHHVNSSRNDFSNWIKGSIKDESLGKAIEKLKDRNEILLEVRKRIISVESKIEKKHKMEKEDMAETHDSIKDLKKQVIEDKLDNEKLIKENVKSFLSGIAIGIAIGIVISFYLGI